VSYQPQTPYIPGPGYTPQAIPPAGPTPPRRSKTMPILIVALVLLAGVAAALAFVLIGGRSGSKPAVRPAAAAASAHIDPGAGFQVIDETCRTSMPSYDIEDAGHTLILTVGGPNGMSSDSMTCVFNSLNVPASVREHIGTTRALDGQQTDSWDDFTARWTYHPDDGLQMTIREA
jgi:hypothetical protein